MKFIDFYDGGESLGKKQREKYMMEDALYKRIRKAVFLFILTVLYSVELIYEIHRYVGSHDKRLVAGIVLLIIIFGILVWFLFVSVFSLKKTMELLFEEIYETGILDGRQEGVRDFIEKVNKGFDEAFGRSDEQ